MFQKKPLCSLCPLRGHCVQALPWFVNRDSDFFGNRSTRRDLEEISEKIFNAQHSMYNASVKMRISLNIEYCVF